MAADFQVPSGAGTTAGWVWNSPDARLPAARTGPWIDQVDGYGRDEHTIDHGRLVGAVSRGRSHKQDGLFCDDSFEMFQAGPWKCLIASAGAGSAVFSRVGSELACATIKSHLIGVLSKIDLSRHVLEESQFQDRSWNQPGLAQVIDAIEQGVYQASNAILAWVEDRNSEHLGASPERLHVDSIARGRSRELKDRIPESGSNVALRILPRDCYCTLLIGLYSNISLRKSDGTITRTGLMLSFSVGDGMIAAFRRLGRGEPRAVVLMNPDVGANAGETLFLSHVAPSRDSIRSRINMYLYDDVVALVAMTDGVADDYFGHEGMKWLYSDLLINDLIPVSASTDELAKERNRAEEYLQERSRRSREELDLLELETIERSISPEHIKPEAVDGGSGEQMVESLPTQALEVGDLNAKAEALRRQVLEASLSRLIVKETVLEKESSRGRDAVRPIKYSRRYAESLGLTVDEILSNRGLLAAIAQSVNHSVKGSEETQLENVPDTGFKLHSWLDTYRVKGSWDDRTLVMYQTGILP